MFLKRKIAVTTIMLGISIVMLISVTFAQPVTELWIRTDKAYYGYGDQGTLLVTLKNNGPGAIEIKSIEVTFPWFGWYHETWDGNYTMEITDGAIGENGTETYTVEFKVPSESRDRWEVFDEAEVEVKYQYGPETETVKRNIWINVMTPVYNENIMPIYYLTAVLTIAVIIAIIELYFVWKRLGRPTHAPITA